jgi:Tfp pilus assembly protein PilE/fibronectin type 3 domain-containing protein
MDLGTCAQRRQRGAFTLIEGLVVLIVMALIAGIGVAGYIKISTDSRRDQATTLLSAVGAAQQSWYKSHGSFVTFTGATDDDERGNVNALLQHLVRGGEHGTKTDEYETEYIPGNQAVDPDRPLKEVSVGRGVTAANDVLLGLTTMSSTGECAGYIVTPSGSSVAGFGPAFVEDMDCSAQALIVDHFGGTTTDDGDVTDGTPGSDTDPVPGAPTNLVASPGPGRITLTWDPPAGADAAATPTAYIITASAQGPGQSAGEYEQLMVVDATATSFVDGVLRTLDPETTYSYKVTAMRGAKESAPAGPVTAKPGEEISGALAKPSGFEATWRNGQVYLSWQPVTGATGYRLSRGEPAPGEAFACHGTATGCTGQTHIPDAPTVGQADTTTGLGQTVTYWLVAVNDTRSSDAARVTFTTPTPAPANVTAANVAVDDDGLYGDGDAPKPATGVKVSWNAPQVTAQEWSTAAPIQGYVVFRCPDTDCDVNTTDAALAGTVTDPDTTSFVDTTAQPATRYGYKVAALNGSTSGHHNASAAATLTTTPAAPTNLASTGAVADQITLTWDAPAGEVTGYHVWRRGTNGTWTHLGTTTTTIFTDTGAGLPDGTLRAWPTTYTYRVAAIGAAGIGAVATGPDGGAYTTEQAIRGIHAITTATTVTLTWKRVEGVAYEITRNGEVIAAQVHTGSYTDRGNNDSGLVPGTKYTYTITALLGTKRSTTETLTIPTRPAAPAVTATTTGPAAGGPGDSTTTLTITPAGGNATVTKYLVYKCTYTPADGTCTPGELVGSTDKTTYTDSNPRGRFVRYAVAAVADQTTGPVTLDSDGEGAASTPVTTASQPGDITDLAISGVETGKVTLSWSAINVATSYQVARKPVGSSAPYTWVATVPAPGVSFTDTTAVGGTDYSYLVHPTNAAGSGTSNAVSTTTHPDIPTGVGVNAGAVTARVTWLSHGADGYRIYRCDGPDCAPATLVATLTDGATKTFTDTGLKAQQWYTYAVAAGRKTGSTWSWSKLSLPASAKTTLDPVEHLRVGTVTSTTIALSWDATPGAVSYKVFRDGTAVATVTATSYTDTGLTPGTPYTYRVRAVAANGEESPYNINPDQVIASTVLPAPGSFQVTGNHAFSLDVAWGQVTGATSYQVVGCEGAGPCTTWATYATFPDGTATSGTVTGLKANTRYTLAVRARTAYVESVLSEPVTTWTTPDAQNNLTIGTRTSKTVGMSWPAVPNAVRYDIYRDGLHVGTTTAPSTGFTDGKNMLPADLSTGGELTGAITGIGLNGNYDLESVTDVKAGGSRGWKVTAKGTTTSAQAFLAARESGTIVPGRPYTYSAKIQAPAGSGNIRLSVIFYKTYRDATGTLRRTQVAYKNTTVVPTGTWQTATATATPPVGATEVYTFLGSYDTRAAGDVIYVDELQLEQGSTATAFLPGGLDPNGEYDYTYTATNAGGESLPGAAAPAKLLPAAPIVGAEPGAPGSTGYREVTARWYPVTGATGYDVFVCPGTDCDPATDGRRAAENITGATGPNSRYHVIDKLADNATYRVAVVARGTNGDVSVPSQTAQATTAPAVTSPVSQGPASTTAQWVGWSPIRELVKNGTGANGTADYARSGRGKLTHVTDATDGHLRYEVVTADSPGNHYIFARLHGALDADSYVAPVAPGQEVTAGVRLTAASDSVAPVTARLVMYFVRWDGTKYVNLSSVTTPITTFAPGAPWQDFTTSAVAPAGADGVKIYPIFAGTAPEVGSALLFDDLSLKVHAAGAATYKVYREPDLTTPVYTGDGGLGANKVADGGTFEDATISWGANGATLTRTTDTARTGTASGLYTRTNTGASVSAYPYVGAAGTVRGGVYMPVTAGETVTASMWLKGETSSPTNGGAYQVRGLIYWLDGDNVHRGSSTTRTITLSTSSWTELAFDGTAPAWARSALVVMQPQTKAVGDKLYVDDVVVTTDRAGFEDKGRTGGTAYSYRVQACSDNGCSVLSDPASLVTRSNPVTSLTATHRTDTTVELSWAPPAPATHVTNYRLTVTGGGQPDRVLDLGLGTSYTVTGLLPDKAYTFTVQANSPAGHSAGTTITAATRPTPAIDLTATAIGADRVALAWSRPAGTDETGSTYTVYRDGTVVATGVSTRTFTVTGLASATEYTFTVKVTGGAGQDSELSNPLKVTTLPAAVTNLRVTGSTQDTIDIAWNAPTGAVTGYEITLTGGGAPGATYTTTATSYTLTGLKADTPYTISVRAASAGGYGASATVNGATRPTPAVNLRATTVGATSLTLAWDRPAGTVETGSTYTVYRDGVQLAEGLTGKTFTDTGLVAGTTYSYTVRVTGAAGQTSELSPALAVTTLPPAVTGLAVTATTENSATLTWTRPAGVVTGYQLLVTGPGVNRTIELGLVTTTTVTGLTSDSLYTFTIAAKNTSGAGAGSTTTGATKPTAPVDLRATTIGATSIALAWSRSAGSPETGATYTVYRDGVQVATGITTKAYTVTGLTPATAYTFTVRTTGAHGHTSALSAPLTATTVPAAPTNLVVTDIWQDRLTLSWAKPAGAVTGFEVTISGGGQATRTFTHDATVTTQTITGLLADKSYTLTVKARSAGGYGAGASTTASTLPAPVTNLRATSVGADRVALAWDRPAGTVETGSTYRVYRDGALVATGITGKSYTVTGLDSATAYTFTVGVTGAAGADGGISDPITATTLPAAVRNLTLTGATTSSLSVTWNAPGGVITSYEVSAAAPGHTTRTVTVNAPTTAATVTGLDPDVTYTITVKARSAGGQGAGASITGATVPTNAVNLRATNITTTGFTLSWERPAGTVETGSTYTIFRDGTQVATGITTKSYTVTGLNPATAYTFTVQVNGAAGRPSTISDPLSVTTLPEKVTNLTLTGRTETTLGLSWTAPAGAVTGYEVAVIVGGLAERTITLPATATTTTVTGLNPDSTYTLAVSAKTAGGTGADSRVTGATLPTKATNLRATTIGASSITLAWDRPAGTVEAGSTYTVYRDGTAVQTGITTKSYTVSGLTTATAYTFTVRVTGGAGQVSAMSDPVNATTLPSVVTNLTTSNPGQDRLTVSWTAAPRAVTGYQLVVTGGGQPERTFDLGAAVTSHVVTGLLADKTYTFTVRAKSAGGYGAAATVDGATLPAPVTNLRATTINPTSITLAWDRPAGTVETGSTYTVYRDGAQVATGVTAKTYTVTGLATATAYTFTVKVTGASGADGGISDPVTVTTLPAAITGLTVTGATENSVSLAWNAASGAITRYEVTVTGGGQPERVVNINAPATTAVITGLLADKTYTFTVRARSAGGLGAAATTTGATVPTGITGLSLVSLTTTSATLSWTRPAGTDETGSTYRVYRNGELIASEVAAKTYTATGLSPATSYTFTVQVVGGSGQTSAPSSSLPVTTLPEAVGTLTLTGITETTATLSWTKPSGTITGYRLVATAPGQTTKTVDLGTVTSHTLTGLAADTTWTFSLQARSGGGLGAAKTVTGKTLPTPVTGFAVTGATDTTITLGWNRPNGTVETGSTYTIFRDGTQVATGITTKSYTVTGLSSATTYQFSIRVTGASGAVGPVSDPITGTTLPSAPTNLATSGHGQDRITLTWTKPAGTLTGYELVVTAPGQTAKTFTPAASATSQQVTGLAADTTYTFTLRARSAGGYSVAATTTAATLPPAVTNLRATAVGTTAVTLAWDHSAQPGATYTVFRNGTAVATGVTTKSYQVTGLTAATAYSFTVQVIGAGGQPSAISSALPVTTVPNPVTNLKVTTVTDTTITLNWTASAGAITTYEVDITGGGQPNRTVNAGKVTSYTVTGLLPDKAYTFTVRALSAGGSSTGASVNGITNPGAATNLRATTIATTSVALAWDHAGGTGVTYNVLRNGSVIATGLTTKTYTATGLAGATSYTFTVQVVGANGQTSSTSAPLSVTTTPAAVTNFRAFDPTENRIDLAWTAPSGAVTGYELTITGGGQPARVLDLGTSTSYRVGDLAADTSYTFTIRARSAGGLGPAATANAATLPQPAVGLTVTGVGATTVDLAWQRPSGTTETGSTYTVYRNGVAIVTGLTGKTYTVTELSPATAYEFTITVTGANGQVSGHSNVAGATTLPAAVTGLATSSPTTTSLVVSWAQPSGAITGYELVVSGGGQATRTIPLGLVTTTTVTGLLADKTYTFSLRASSAGGFGAAATTTGATLPQAVTNLRMTGNTTSSIALAWDHAGGTGVTYTVLRGGTQVATGLTGKTYTVTGLSPATAYSFTVVVNGAAGQSSAASAALSATTLPGAVTGLSLTGTTTTTASLAWTKPAGTITGYKVVVTGGGQPERTITLGTGTTTTVTGLLPDKTYTFTVSAASAGGYGAGVAVTGATVPDAATSLRSTGATDTTIALAWDHAGGTGVTYTVLRGGTQVATGLTGKTYTATGLSGATSYTFTVVVNGAAGKASAASAPLTAWTTPAAPGNLTVGSATGTTLTASWTAPSGTVTGYELAVTGGGQPAQTFDLGLVTSKQVTGLNPDTVYTFTLRARSAGGLGPAATKTGATRPEPITNLRATTITTTSVALDWDRPAGTVETGSTYTVYRNGVAIVSGLTAKSYTATGLASATAYTFTVGVTGAAGADGGTSDPLTVTTRADAPTGLTGVPTDTGVQLSWTKPAGTITGYLVYSCSGASCTPANPVPVTGTTHFVATDPDATYRFQVTALVAGGLESEKSDVLPVATRPGQVSGLTATGANKKITLSWTGRANATDYAIYRVAGTGTPATTGTPWKVVTTTSHVDTDVNPGAQYTYRVVARRHVTGTTYALGAASANATGLTAPAAPTNLANTTTHDSATLTWTGVSGTVTGYRVYRNGSLVATVAAPTTTWTNTGLTAGSTWSYQVFAYNASGNGDGSNTTTAYVQVQAPTNLKVDGVGDTWARISWTKPTGTLAGFTVYRGTTKLIDLPATATSHLLDDLEPGASTTYQVTARAAGNYETPKSNQVSVTATIGAPTGLTATGHPSTAGRIDVTFNHGVQNRVINGQGQLGDNTNFPTLTWTTEDKPAGVPGSWVTAQGPTSSMLSTQVIPVNPEESYSLSMTARQTGTSTNSGVYLGLAPVDASGQVISPNHYYHLAASMTTLAAPLNPGDTTVKVTSAAGWAISGTNNYVGLWNWTDPQGMTWPAGTYTRNTPAFDAINGNTITLRAAYTGPALPAGTPVSNNRSGSSYMYALTSGTVIPSTWTTYSATVGGVHNTSSGSATRAFPPATRGVKIMMLPNYTGDRANSRHAIADITFGQAYRPANVSYQVFRCDDSTSCTPATTGTPVKADLTTTTWADTGRANGTWYGYAVRARHSGGTTSAVEGTARALTLPAAPTGLAVTAEHTTATVSLAAVKSATKYRVTVTGVGTFEATTPSIPVTGLTASTYYNYSVQAYNQTGWGPATAATNPFLTKPAASTLTVNPGYRKFDLSWTTVPTVHTYEVWACSGASCAPGSGIKVYSGPATSYTMGNLGDNATYRFIVRTSNDAGGADSAIQSARTAPAIPANLRSTAATDTSITMAWNASTGAATYQLHRDGTALPTLGNVTTWTNTGLTADTYYKYDVRAANSPEGTWSDRSTQVQVATKPTAPTGLTATPNGTGQVTLSWSAAPHGTKYRVYACTTAATSCTPGGSPVAEVTSGTSHTLTVPAGQRAFAYVTVISTKTSLESAPSATVSSTTVPSAPTGLTRVSGTTSSQTFSWTAINHARPGDLRYELGYRLKSSSGDYTWVSAASATSGTITGLIAGTAYTVVVRVKDVGVTPNLTSPNSSAPPYAETRPKAPVITDVAPGGGSEVLVYWQYTQNTNATYRFVLNDEVKGFATSSPAPTSVAGYSPHVDIKLRALNTHGEAADSNVWRWNTAPPDPTTPPRVRVDDKGQVFVTVDTLDTATAYQLRRTGAGVTKETPQFPIVSQTADAVTFLDTYTATNAAGSTAASPATTYIPGYQGAVSDDTPFTYHRLDDVPGKDVVNVAQTKQAAASLTGTVTSTTPVAPGASSSAKVTTTTRLYRASTLTTGAGLTQMVEAWVSFPATVAPAGATLFTLGSSKVRLREVNGQMIFGVGSSLTPDTPVGINAADLLGQTHHVVISNKNGVANSVTIWVDGVRYTTNAVAQTWSGNFEISASSNGWDGAIGAVSIYKDSAPFSVLTPAQIREHYHSGDATQIARADGAWAHWALEGASVAGYAASTSSPSGKVNVNQAGTSPNARIQWSTGTSAPTLVSRLAPSGAGALELKSGTSGVSTITGLLPTANGESFTVELWIKRGSTVATAWHAIWSTNSVTGTNGGNLTLMLRPEGLGLNAGGGELYGVPLTDVPANEPVHVVAVIANGSSANTKLYINGEQKTLTNLLAGKTPKETAWKPGGSFIIGRNATDTQYPWAGVVDNLALYPHALTSTQVEKLANTRSSVVRQQLAYGAAVVHAMDQVAQYVYGVQWAGSEGTTAQSAIAGAPGLAPGSLASMDFIPGVDGGTASGGAMRATGGIETSNVGLSTTSGATNTIEAWATMPLSGTSGFLIKFEEGFSIYAKGGRLGLNIPGYSRLSSSTFTPGQQLHIVAELRNGSIANSKLWVNGVAQTLSTTEGTLGSDNTAKQIVTTSPFIGFEKQPTRRNYHWAGQIDEVAFYTGAIGSTVATHYTAAHAARAIWSRTQLVAHFPMDDLGAGDYSGNHRTGGVNTAADAGFVYSSMNTVNSADTLPTHTQAQSYEFWVKGTRAEAGAAWLLRHNPHSTATSPAARDRFSLAPEFNGTTRQLVLRGNPTATPLTWTVSANLYDGNFHHIVLTKNTSSTWTLYVDGVNLGAKTMSSMGSLTTYDAIEVPIGARPASTADAVDGTMTAHNLAIYKATLSATQVARHYAAGPVPLVAPNAPTFIFNAAKAQLNISWNNVPGADSYEVSLGSTTLYTPDSNITISHLSGSVTARVRAVDAAGNPGPWSPYSTFNGGSGGGTGPNPGT